MVGFGAFKIFYPGIPPGFDEQVWTISTNVNYSFNEGQELCIDSTWYPPSNDWVWAVDPQSGRGSLTPDWEGPCCFEVQSSLVEFRGYLKYLDLAPPDATAKPMRGVIVELWDDDPPASAQLLATDTVDELGYFTLGPVHNTDVFGSAGQDPFFRIYAANEIAYATDDTASTDRYYWQTEVYEDIFGGIYDTTLLLDTDSAKYFFAVDLILAGYERWMAEGGGEIWLPGYPMRVVVAPDTLKSHLHLEPGRSCIFINDSDYIFNNWPDSWDAATIIHEYGHWISYTNSFFDDALHQSPDSHYMWCMTNAEHAAGEAISHWWAAVVLHDPVKRNFCNFLRDFEWYNLENGEWGDSGMSGNLLYGSFNAMGDACQGSVAGILWDIFDESDDDASGLGDWGSTSLPHHPDGIGDAISFTTADIIENLQNRPADDGDFPDNMSEFWQAWFAEPSLGCCAEMKDVWYEHGKRAQTREICCCYGIRGNFDGDPNDLINVSDLTYFVAYFFASGSPPPCWDEGNINGDADLSIVDLTFLVCYLFGSGCTPPQCP